MISQEAVQKILGIEEKTYITPTEMADKLNITFYPKRGSGISKNVDDFNDKLIKAFNDLKVNIVPYSESLEKVQLKKRIKRFIKLNLNNLLWIFRKLIQKPQTSFYINFKSILRMTGPFRIKKGISVVSLGEQPSDCLPMQYISNFKDNTVVTIIDFPNNINPESTFIEHFDTAMSLFAFHMTNIVIAVDKEKWMLYNFNASHPIYKLDDGKFKEHLLNALIPKIVAPISPHRFSEFKISNEKFNINDDKSKEIINDLISGSTLFNRTNLYPKGKKIDDLPFRDNFHKLIGKMHLDNRSGMSFGFFAKQMPTELSIPIKKSEFIKKAGRDVFEYNDYYINDMGEIYTLIEIDGFDEPYSIKVPDVWVMSLRSGSDKTHIIPEKDLLKLGLKNGKMWMEFPEGLEVDNDYKPSFDTKVILAHAVGNAILASIMKFNNSNPNYVNNIEKKGISISHWHGYFNEKCIPDGFMVHGGNNPHVACSSPQSAIYALMGKLSSFVDVNKSKLNYNGDIHIEPHHGTNISYPSLVSLAEFLINNPEASVLGNKYINF